MAFGLRISVKGQKCQFGKSSIDYLGYKVSKEGIAPLKRKIDAIHEIPTPSNQKQLLHFLGAINYFRSSLGRLPPDEPGQKSKSAAEVLMPLYAVATCKMGTKTKFQEMWNTTIQKAFEDTKKLLIQAVELNFPDPSAPLALTCDASLVALGACLEQ